MHSNHCARLQFAAFCIVGIFSSHGFAATEAWNRAEFEKAVLVIQQSESMYGAGEVSELESQSKRQLSEGEKRLFSRKDEGAWRQFADEYLSFDFPDDPQLKVETIEPKARGRIQVVGGAVGTTDNDFLRAYRLTVNDLPYGVVLLAEADWFDDGICLCGPIALKRLLLREGTLLEFSLLPEGKVKKVQALGGRHRAVLFEWTHSVLTQETYARIGASLRLAEPSKRSRNEWTMLMEQRRSDDRFATLGWLDPGTPEGGIAQLLGMPVRRRENCLVYEKDIWREDGAGGRITISVPVEAGRFTKLQADFAAYAELPPRQNSLAWAENLLGSDAKAFMSVLEQFKLQAPAIKDYHRWDKWCRMVHEISELGHQDASVLPIVKERFLDIELNQHYSAWILHDYNAAGAEELFRQRLAIVLTDTAGPKEKIKTDVFEVSNLLSFMNLKEKDSIDLLRQTLQHPDPTVRASGYGKGKALPAAEARVLARHAIEAEQDDHALTMATHLLQETGILEDADWLGVREDRFKTKELRELCQETVHALKQRSEKKEP